MIYGIIQSLHRRADFVGRALLAGVTGAVLPWAILLHQSVPGERRLSDGDAAICSALLAGGFAALAVAVAVTRAAWRKPGVGAGVLVVLTMTTALVVLADAAALWWLLVAVT
jgi:hypothetical protein